MGGKSSAGNENAELCAVRSTPGRELRHELAGWSRTDVEPLWHPPALRLHEAWKHLHSPSQAKNLRFFSPCAFGLWLEIISPGSA